MRTLNRRKFLCSGAALLATALPAEAFWPFSAGRSTANPGHEDIRGRVFRGDAPEALWKWSREAYAYKKIKNDGVVCGVCPHRCVLLPGDRSICRSRVNMEGALYSLTYGNPCAVNIDPIEKKPLYHFMPTSRAFSVAASGCNFRCLNCQNWEISQAKPHEVRHRELFPPQVVAEARQAGCESIAYTYSEPVTFFEYMLDTARLAKAAGVYNLLISNGYINTDPLRSLCREIDAANVNLKSFSDDIHKRLNGGRLQPVLNTFKTLHRQGVHFEMTNLVVPGYVDDPAMVRAMCDWILANIGPDHPIHFSRFFPKYKLDRLAPTPVATLEQFRDLAMTAGIRYVYVGNVPGHDGNNTYCHSCKKLIIAREGYHITAYHLKENRCRFCNTVIPGRWPADGLGGYGDGPKSADLL